MAGGLRRFITLFALGGAAWVLVGTSSVRAQQPASSSTANSVAGAGKYIGPGSCSASGCHGAIVPHSVVQQGGTYRVLQNEYSTWVTEDKHARAYTSLTGSLGRQMSAVLKIGTAEKAPKCLVCHALPAAPETHAREFDIAEGVSCESCHGGASMWLGPHVIRDGKEPDEDRTERLRKLGLVNNESLVTRTRQCLTCHLGNGSAVDGGMQVDHEMIAAGHPDLRFELDSYTAVEPPHWIEKSQDPLFGMRAWAVGQAVQLQESMLRLSRRAHAGPWPEFSEMDCITCHHSLTGPESWRQKSLEVHEPVGDGVPGHRAGDPPYNLARYVIFRHFAREIDSATARELETSAEEVARLVTAMSADRGTVEMAAKHAADLAGKMVAEIDGAQYDRARDTRLLRAISGDADVISRQGERTAEQATMSLDSLYIAGSKGGGMSAGTRAAIDKLFTQIKNPSGYNAPSFAAGMKEVEGTLH